MKIEPCPICGGTNVRIISNTGDSVGAECLSEEDLLEMKAEVRCVECGHSGGKSWGRWLKSSNKHCLKERIDEWNRLSRIVRAAEAWAACKKALNGIPPNPNIYHFDKKWEHSKIELQYAEVRLLVAVEGGQE